MQSHIVWLAVAVILPLNAGCGGQLTPTPSPIFDGLMLNYILPAAGNPDGSTSVTLAGGVFQAGATVTFDGIPASEVVVNSGTEIRARTPPHGEGTEGYPSIIFVIQNDRLVTFGCDSSPAVTLSPSIPIQNGAFASSSAGGVTIAGRLVTASAAKGTSQIGACQGNWYAARY